MYQENSLPLPKLFSLSRNFVSKTYPSLTKNLEALVHSVLANLQISDRKLLEARWETEVNKLF